MERLTFFKMNDDDDDDDLTGGVAYDPGLSENYKHE